MDRFFTTVYGNTTGLFVVLGIVYEEYYKLGIKSKVAVQKMVSRDLKERQSIKCLDLSSIIDVLPEVAGNINIELFAPPL